MPPSCGLARPGSPLVEIIRVPLDPRSGALRRLAHPGTTTLAAGVTLALRDLGVTHLTYTYTYAPHGSPPYPVASRIDVPAEDLFTPLRDALRNAAGHAVPTVARPTVCATGAHVLRCATTIVFPPQPPGARLTLTIRALQLNLFGYRKSRLGPIAPRPTQGLWRLPVVIP